MWYSVPLMLLEAATLYSLPGWHLFKGIVPSAVWSAVDSAWTTSLQGFMTLTIAFNAVFVAFMMVDWRMSLNKEPRRNE